VALLPLQSHPLNYYGGTNRSGSGYPVLSVDMHAKCPGIAFLEKISNDKAT
jgi:hypothetical protein